MRVTPNLNRGFVGRSLDEFKKQAAFALSGEAVKRATKPYILHTFHEPSSIAACKVMSDKDIGGFSASHLDYIPPVTTASSPSQNPHGHAKFHGNISIELPKDRPDVQRTGFAAWRTHDRPPTIFGKSLWNVDVYAFLALRIKSDGRKYFVNLQTESIVPTDIHQHRLYARRPGEWETVLIKWGEFVRTNHGMVVEPQREIMKQKLRTVGIGLIDRVPGPFELCVERIWATNEMGVEDIREDERGEEGMLKDSHGRRIKWGDKGEK
ncbi:Galactose-binding protein [Glarea lozoyensis ATCC 20868]|uniref:Galactose-binding protein n=1 Tax=Glarea lozoyensis (strain ATCC 20868 / MF5171) TaxID=1116229 RepID=S3D076_GLAL2|nr:Galactose-binding protein [Glarea lozoyensis ATCC 20868]EPE31922.1 Galactose-binding protein [Glarea lozoyensis ATCC 20868]